MKKTNILLLVTLSLLLTNCNNNEKPFFLIKGEIKGKFNNYLYLSVSEQMDSALVVNNKFEFKGHVSAPIGVNIFPAKPNPTERMTAVPFMLENSIISLKLKYSEREFRGINTKILVLDSIKGSKTQDLKDRFELKMKNTVYEEKNDSLKKERFYSNLYELLSENPKSVVSGTYLAYLNDMNDYLSSKQLSELFNLIDTTYQAKNDLATIQNIINRRSVLEIGIKPPPIKLPNQNGEIIDSNSLKGKIVLYEFWASWCFPCRKTNAELSEIYKKYKDDGFEVLGVSQDKNIEKWKNAIKEDNIEWVQVIDTLNNIGEMYYLTTIPFNMLLNRDGKIIARNIKPTKLNEILTERIQK